jgi:hypothetical protein
VTWKTKRVYVAFLGLHFALVFLIGSQQAMSVMSQGATLLPPAWDSFFSRGEDIASAALGQDLAFSNPFRQLIAAYTYSAGIETGYGFFAPSVVPARKMVFEIRYDNGRVEYELPGVGGAATGHRLTLLFENIERIRYEPLRKMMFKMMAFSIWREHPEAVQVRVVFGFVNTPTISEFQHGKSTSYEVLYVYDFSPPRRPVGP